MLLLSFMLDYGETLPKKKKLLPGQLTNVDTRTGEGMEMSSRQSGTAPSTSTGLVDVMKLHPKDPCSSLMCWECIVLFCLCSC